MRIALISDSHTKENIEFILNYLKNKATSWKIDSIMINGDILGENEIKEEYGFNSKKSIFHASLNKKEMLKKLSPDFENLLKIQQIYEKGIKDENVDIEMSGFIKNYVEQRYNDLFELLLKFSQIKQTYFNIGTYESPLHYKVLNELAFLIDVPQTYVRSIAMLSNYRDTFKVFLAKINDPKLKKLKYIGGNTVLLKDLLIAAIPGLHESSNTVDKTSEFQEKITTDLLHTITRQLSYVNKLILLNPVQAKLRKDPFSYRPSSTAVRKFIESLKGKLRHKVFIQSYHHVMTTHFYNASEFNYILANSAVNNCLFNILEVSSKIDCFDVDAKLDRVRKLKLYNYNVAEWDTPKERLALNYEESDEIIKERQLNGCYYL